MICINDEHADGRDSELAVGRGLHLPCVVPAFGMVSGVRAWDMALRLEYDQVPVEAVSTELEQSRHGIRKRRTPVRASTSTAHTPPCSRCALPWSRLSPSVSDAEAW